MLSNNFSEENNHYIRKWVYFLLKLYGRIRANSTTFMSGGIWRKLLGDFWKIIDYKKGRQQSQKTERIKVFLKNQKKGWGGS